MLAWILIFTIMVTTVLAVAMSQHRDADSPL
jgi:hypothetical protein